MIRRLLPILTFLSLLLWLLALVAWIRSHSGTDGVSFSSVGRFIHLSMGRDLDLVVVENGAGAERSEWIHTPSRGFNDSSPDFGIVTMSPGAPNVAEFSAPGLRIRTYSYATFYMVNSRVESGVNKLILPTQPITQITFTRWIILLTLPAILPIARIVMTYRNRRRRMYRAQHQLCVACGYDLRSSTDKCPECGTPIAIIQG